MNSFSHLFQLLEQTRFKPHIDTLQVRLEFAETQFDHGEKINWQSILQSLPEISPNDYRLDRDIISIDTESDISDEQQVKLEANLRQLHPWRKGPYQIFNIFINSEWRSDYKWNRLIPQIKPLKGKRVLDVGTGNGYHCWRARGEGADLVLGIEPQRLCTVQFQAVKMYLSDEPVFVVPLAMQEFPEACKTFDTVFSMGVFYHTRSPIDHLIQLRLALIPGGELILETLVVEGNHETVLIPENRYAKMRNVWFIPSVLMLETMLKRAGFSDIHLVNLNQTTTDEQRSTDWMTFESLTDFLSPNDPQKTVEGHPAPLRAIFIAKAPE
ncbi:MAG: tRNA 5-methoxyuridine(34)/uridine 5-oxyacetic acid(34) synthase CmoB [Candidatus Marinimicrobia bacterium]|nr:tRNA 5-methoxyuridine(34)/uridine 5-oxyacetic acid(34) synthase CmoB [Candidatus Neomarinimicrobiota bacterium]